MILSLMLVSATIGQYTATPTNNSNEAQVQACIATCYAYADKPSYDLKGCVIQCQDLAKP